MLIFIEIEECFNQVFLSTVDMCMLVFDSIVSKSTNTNLSLIFFKKRFNLKVEKLIAVLIIQDWQSFWISGLFSEVKDKLKAFGNNHSIVWISM